MNVIQAHIGNDADALLNTRTELLAHYQLSVYTAMTGSLAPRLYDVKVS
jgi:hypothetical protein